MAKYTDAEIEAMGKKGQAFKNPDGHYSYPIGDAEDLDDAIKAVGRGGADHDAIRRHIIGRAKALGKSSMIPGNWSADGSIGESQGLDRAAFELRKRRRGSMFGKPERRALLFALGGVELRAKPSGHGTTNFEFNGYAVVYNTPFQMWDQWGDEYEENVETRACGPSLARADLDTPFLIGHDDGGIALARTRSGTMRLADESHGLHVNVPELDGRSPLVQSLASAIERKDMDEMSVGFVCRRQQWSGDWMRRNVQEMDIHRGDVSIVVLGANSATAGATLTVPGLEAASARRRDEERARGEIADAENHPDFNLPAYDPVGHGPESITCPHDSCPVYKGSGGSTRAQNAKDAKCCDQCGGPLYDGDGLMVLDDSGVMEEVGGDMADANVLSRKLRLLELA